MSIFGNAANDRRPAYYMNHISGVSGMTQWQPLKIIFDTSNKELVIGDKNMDRISRLKLNQLVSVGVVKSQDIQNEKNNSVSMAAAGGLLFGDTGAIVGSIIGSSRHSSKKNVDCFILNYSPQSAPGSVNTIVLEVPGGSMAGSYLWENLKPYCKGKSVTANASSYL